MTQNDNRPDAGAEPAAFGPAEEYLRHGEAVQHYGWQEAAEAHAAAGPAEPGSGPGTSHRPHIAPAGAISRDVRVLDRLRAHHAEQAGGDR